MHKDVVYIIKYLYTWDIIHIMQFILYLQVCVCMYICGTLFKPSKKKRNPVTCNIDKPGGHYAK